MAGLLLEAMLFHRILFILTLLWALAGGVAAQTAASGEEFDVVAATFPENENVKVSLTATGRLPGATGSAEVKRRRGVTELGVKLDDMQAAILFGGDYNTFVLWVISPERVATNVGEIILKGTDGDLDATTTLTSFGLLVTAEPHYLVDKPSHLVIFFSNAAGLNSQDGVSAIPLTYSDVRRYNYERASLTGEAKISGESRSDRHQAVIAIRFAEEEGAQEWAPAVFAEARSALSETLQAFGQGTPQEELTVLSHRAVRLAVYARRLAIERREAAMLADERKTSRETIARLQTEKASAEAEVARLTDLNARLDESLEQTSVRLQDVEKTLLQANQEADQLAREKAAAERMATAAKDQAAGFYVRMYNALERTAELRETERGLTVSLSDVLFASGSSRLQVSAREVLSRIAGVLMIAPEYHLGIEGHTDSTGRTNLNQKLSQERAEAVRNYLAECGISAASMTTRGFGESKPIASNRTAAGRKQNRRVEIIIEGLIEQP